MANDQLVSKILMSCDVVLVLHLCPPPPGLSADTNVRNLSAARDVD